MCYSKDIWVDLTNLSDLIFNLTVLHCIVVAFTSSKIWRFLYAFIMSNIRHKTVLAIFCPSNPNSCFCFVNGRQSVSMFCFPFCQVIPYLQIEVILNSLFWSFGHLGLGFLLGVGVLLGVRLLLGVGLLDLVTLLVIVSF